MAGRKSGSLLAVVCLVELASSTNRCAALEIHYHDRMIAAQTVELNAAEDEAFREQCRRQMELPLSARMNYGFCRINRPVLDTPGIRVFNSTREYRASRKWRSGLAALLSLLLLGGMTRLAAQEQQFGDFTYSSDGSAITIVRFTGAGGDVTIPDTIEGLPVRAIQAYAFVYSTLPLHVTVPGTIYSIGSSAFADSRSLVSVTISDGVTSIEFGAFSGCTELTGVTIPNSVTLIEGGAFYRCAALTSITIPGGVSSIEESTFAWCTGLTSVVMSNGIASIGPNAFNGCTNLGSVSIPDSVTTIGYRSFTFCPSLTNISIPDSVTSIGFEAFANCTGLTNIVIPNSVLSIGGGAFYRCSGLISVTLPTSITSIEGSTFFDCIGLTSVAIPDSVVSIGWYAFGSCTGLTGATIPRNVTSFGGYAFSGCANLSGIDVVADNPVFRDVDGVVFDQAMTTLVAYPAGRTGTYGIPEGVTRIGRAAFAGSAGLTGLAIPGSVTSIEGSAFYRCSGLTSITIPDSVAFIGGEAFAECTNLADIALGNGVTSIDDETFSRCTSLTSITLPASLTHLASDAFYACVNLVSILMLGNAPATSYVDPDDFLGFTVYYYEGNTGFTPDWRGYRTVAVPRFDPAEASLKVLALPSREGKFSLVVFGQEGRTYQLQRHSDLTDAAPWMPVTTTEALTTDRVVELTDTAPPSGQAFYRAIEMAP